MDRQFITTDESPVVVIESVQGDLRLKGHADLEVAAKASTVEDLRMETRDGRDRAQQPERPERARSPPGNGARADRPRRRHLQGAGRQPGGGHRSR